MLNEIITTPLSYNFTNYLTGKVPGLTMAITKQVEGQKAD